MCAWARLRLYFTTETPLLIKQSDREKYNKFFVTQMEIVSKLYTPFAEDGVVISFLQNKNLIPAHEFSCELCSEKESQSTLTLNMFLV